MTDEDEEVIKRVLHLMTEAMAVLRVLVSERSNYEPSIGEIDEEFLGSRLNNLDFGGFDARMQNVFRNLNLETVREVVAMDQAEWMRTPNFGRKSLLCLKSVLAEHGLRLGMFPNGR